MQIYIQRNGQQIGPFTEAEFKAKLASGEISPQDHVWYQGMANWMPVAQSPLAGPVTPGFPGQPPISQPPFPAPLEAEAKTSGMAIASLICSIVGLFFLPLLILGIILGHISLSQIKKNPQIKGRGLALGGVITGYVGFCLIMISIIAISVLIALGNQVKETFKTIDSQLKSEQAQSSQDTTTSTNSADQSAPATTTSPDQSTTTPSTDQSAMPSTPATTPTTTPTDSSTTNATPTVAP